MMTFNSFAYISLATSATAVFVFMTDIRNPSVAENVHYECKAEIGLATRLP